ncbi:LPXTG cell wall anchor domain-containing protein [Streptomyces sp. NBC_01497]|uniref:LPXTG cell wall anchor domain-containing protein n=1 Tax=Streptomyces sp. NBC_01497 TaxID=2903885 RepID=UPI002E345708|nr:LPXTG cell wall anchor domain-containing protein [Streptomyces sp. NBC_01497]
MAAALTLAGVGSASAHDKGGQGQGHCGAVQLKFSTDGGNSWTTNDTIGSAPSSIQVKLTGNVTKGCDYPVSLAAYKADGPSWESSGTQVFLGVDQATLSKGTKQATLQVKGIDKSDCFGQIDLYGNNKVYDGKSGALPHYPDSYTPTDLIAHWNGAFDKCDQGGGSTPPSSPPATPPTSPPATPPSSPPVSDTPSPSTSDSTSPSPSTSDSTAPSASPSSSAPAVADTAAPSGTPVAQPVSSTPTLAETGSNSSQTTTFVAAGAALVVIGAGAVVFTRRRNRTQA